MATIRDIAILAGVSQGTVSNVLNGKCNVNSKKIQKVMDAALRLGYVPNERAKLLRQRHSKLLVAVIPNLESKRYMEFYQGFLAYSETNGYSVAIQLSKENSRESESSAILSARSHMAAGIATFTSFRDKDPCNPYKDENGNSKANEQILFVERKVPWSDNYIGFDYEAAGVELARKAIAARHTNICLLTSSLEFSNEEEFYKGFMRTLAGSICKVHHIETDSYRKLQNIMEMLDENKPQAVFISNFDFAEGVKDICRTIYSMESMPIYAVSPLFTLPEEDFIKYELNYRKMGNMAAKKLIYNIEVGNEMKPTILTNSGCRDWYAHVVGGTSQRVLKVLTLDTPSAYSLRQLSKLYTKKTGQTVKVKTLSYNEMYDEFSHLEDKEDYDVLRIDITWLDWFAEKILVPMDQIDPSVMGDLDSFIPGTIERYAIKNGHVYALPSTPSVQLLFYRKDLFQSPINKQMYWEQNKQQLEVPRTFEEFNTISRFFTKSLTPTSPVDFGTTMTLGSTGVASSEFFARLFSLQDDLFDENGETHLDSDNFVRALEMLVEARSYCAPEACSWWSDTAKTFAEGNVAMGILYSNFASNILNASSKVVGNIGFANTPGDNPVLGGGYLGVSKQSTHKDEALSYIRWACSETISSAKTLLGSVSPCRQSFLNYEIVNNYPWLDLAQKSIIKCRGRRKPEWDTRPFNEFSFLKILGTAVKRACAGVISPREALREAQSLYEKTR